MIEPLIAGITLGLYGGFSPGPIVLLVISHTLRYGYIEGLKVSFATIVADVPIILIAIFLLAIVSTYSPILGLISIIGGFYVVYLAYECFKIRGLKEELDGKEKPKSLLKGMSLNLLTPSPYLFWITIAGPIIISTSKEGLLPPALFFIGFYALLIGSKFVLVYAAGKSREFLTGRPYIYIMRILGLALLVFAFYLISGGLQLLNI